MNSPSATESFPDENRRAQRNTPCCGEKACWRVLFIQNHGGNQTLLYWFIDAFPWRTVQNVWMRILAWWLFDCFSQFGLRFCFNFKGFPIMMGCYNCNKVCFDQMRLFASIAKPLNWGKEALCQYSKTTKLGKRGTLPAWQNADFEKRGTLPAWQNH